MTGLADCNNFFVSCERTLDPSLEGKAVVVLSNNDGCVVARSNEAKRLGIKMGQPAFEIRELVNNREVIALSGNHSLYRDISIRVHDIFRRYAPATIDYSVDEAFLDMDGIPASALPEIGAAIGDSCWRELHIPVTLGFAKTKTLAKIVTEVCKKRAVHAGMLTDNNLKWKLLDMTEIRDLWGIGRRLAKKMYQGGVYSIGDFARLDRGLVRKWLGVNGERSWLELHDVSCITLAHVDRSLQDSISETRTFPHDVEDYDYIRARIAIYASYCSQRLRQMGGVCSRATVFLRSNRFHTENGYHAPEMTCRLDAPTDDAVVLVKTCVGLLDRIFSQGIGYKRAGVILSEISDARAVQPSLFNPCPTMREVPEKLMRVIDSLNSGSRSHGTPAMRLASQLTVHHKGYDDGFCISFGSVQP